MKRLVPLLPLIFIAVYVLFGNFFEADTPTTQQAGVKGNVARVLDGDTLEMKDGTRVRLIGINSPEKGQPYGQEATNETRRLLTNKSIELEYDTEEKDSYDRTLAYVYVDDTFLNAHLIKQGLALVETVPPNEKHEGIFMESEIDAQQNCRGLWEGLCVAGERTDTCIEIAQIQADAPGNDNKNLNGEWIRLRNKCLEDIPLDGYLLKDRSASNNYFFKNATLPSSASLTIYSGCGEDTDNSLFWQCPQKRSAIWNNDRDQAYLYNKEGMLTTTKGY